MILNLQEELLEDGYEIEFIIPFSEIPFPNGKNKHGKLKYSVVILMMIMKVLRLGQALVNQAEMLAVNYVYLIIQL